MQNTMQKVDIPLHDIKPLVKIDDYSLYYLIGVVAIVSLLLLGVGYLVFRYIRHRNRFNKRKEDFKNFKNVDQRDVKKAAYALTKYGATFKDDDTRHRKAYENMVERLEKYKYKKEVEPFDSETKHYIELYEAMIDV